MTNCHIQKQNFYIYNYCKTTNYVRITSAVKSSVSQLILKVSLKKKKKNREKSFRVYFLRDRYSYHFFSRGTTLDADCAFALNARAKPAKLTEGTYGDSQGRRTALRRTSTVPEEGKPPPSRTITDELPVTDDTTAAAPIEQSNGSPDSIMSGPLDVDGNSAPDTAESVAPTVPFPPISQSPAPVATSPEAPNRKSPPSPPPQSRANRSNAEEKTKDEQRAFGSPVPVDEDDARF